VKVQVLNNPTGKDRTQAERSNELTVKSGKYWGTGNSMAEVEMGESESRNP